MRSSKTATDAKLTNLFLDMLAAEQGAGDNTLDAYRRDLTDLSEFLIRAGQTFAGAGTDVLDGVRAHPVAAARRLSSERRHAFGGWRRRSRQRDGTA